MVMGYVQDDRGLISGRIRDLDLLHSVNSYSETQWVSGTDFPGVKWDRSLKQTTNLHLVLKARMWALYLHSA
jgi:hypothetical protein